MSIGRSRATMLYTIFWQLNFNFSGHMHNGIRESNLSEEWRRPLKNVEWKRTKPSMTLISCRIELYRRLVVDWFESRFGTESGVTGQPFLERTESGPSNVGRGVTGGGWDGGRVRGRKAGLVWGGDLSGSERERSQPRAEGEGVIGDWSRSRAEGAFSPEHTPLAHLGSRRK